MDYEYSLLAQRAMPVELSGVQFNELSLQNFDILFVKL